MSGIHSIELMLQEGPAGQCLLSPLVGLFTHARAPGEVLQAGQRVGWILSLGREFELRTPEGTRGRVVNAPPKPLRAPVEYGGLLYELAPIASGDGPAASAAGTGTAAPLSSSGWVLRAPQSGRFWHKPAPLEPAFVTTGTLLEEGTPVGWIEVMKTFAHVTYRPVGGLPVRARVVRALTRDGGDVSEGDGLFELEPA
jgi:biotin carboxyl carrier protein